MRNIHVLKTDKPSRLINNDANQLCYQSNKSFKNDRKLRKKFNIYITSDEEIKEGDWLIVNSEDIMQMKSSYDNDMSGENIWVSDSLNGYATYKDNCKKIILTTDQDLIKDDVQAIDDEFLEWFVNNPSCESVEIEKQLGCVELDAVCDFGKISCPNAPNCLKNKYKIIIPKEEPKQETTQEEVAEYLGFVKGAKWQQEQDKNKYSEEEVYNLTQQLRLKLKSGVLKWQDDFEFDLDKWFEQFKKK